RAATRRDRWPRRAPTSFDPARIFEPPPRTRDPAAASAARRDSVARTAPGAPDPTHRRRCVARCRCDECLMSKPWTFLSMQSLLDAAIRAPASHVAVLGHLRSSRGPIADVAEVDVDHFRVLGSERGVQARPDAAQVVIEESHHEVVYDA